MFMSRVCFFPLNLSFCGWLNLHMWNPVTKSRCCTKSCGHGSCGIPLKEDLMPLGNISDCFLEKFVLDLNLEEWAIISWVNVGSEASHTGSNRSHGLETQEEGYNLRMLTWPK